MIHLADDGLLDDGRVTPERQQDQKVLADHKKVKRARQRYSIFIEPYLKTNKGYFRLRMAIHQFPSDLPHGEGLACACGQSFELGYVLQTSEDEKEIVSFVDTVQFSNANPAVLTLYVNILIILIDRKTRRIPLNLLGQDPLQQQCTLIIDIRVGIIVAEFADR